MQTGTYMWLVSEGHSVLGPPPPPVSAGELSLLANFRKGRA